MATITPKYIKTDSQVVVTWANMSTGDTIVEHASIFPPTMPIVQFEGVFGGSTVNITGSLSNIAYLTANSMTQTTIAATSNQAIAIIEPYTYWKPSINGGTADNITTTLVYYA